MRPHSLKQSKNTLSSKQRCRAWITAAKQLLGDPYVITDEAQLLNHCQSWRGQYRGKALCMALPQSVEQVQVLVRLCIQFNLVIVPQGGNTGLTGAAQPDRSGEQVLLNTSRMNRILEVDGDNHAMTVEAGCTLAAIQQAALEHNCLFPLRLASEQSCQIGGNIATNAGGNQVLCYGNTRDLVLGLQAVLADGSVWSALRGLRKNNVGYDLKHLFIGSEGTLGIITHAVLKLYPKPKTEHSVWLNLTSPVDALVVLRTCQSHAKVVAFELMSGYAVGLVRKHVPDTHGFGQSAWHVLMQIHETAALSFEQTPLAEALLRLMDESRLVDVCVANSEREAMAMWKVRESIPVAQNDAGYGVKNDISVPINRIASFVQSCGRMIASHYPQAQPCIFGHLGDGNLHYNMVLERGMDANQAVQIGREIQLAVQQQVMDAQGSISAEHGIGQARKQAMLKMLSPVEVALMRSVKTALDPNNLFNPGKVLDFDT